LLLDFFLFARFSFFCCAWLRRQILGPSLVLHCTFFYNLPFFSPPLGISGPFFFAPSSFSIFLNCNYTCRLPPFSRRISNSPYISGPSYSELHFFYFRLTISSFLPHLKVFSPRFFPNDCSTSRLLLTASSPLLFFRGCLRSPGPLEPSAGPETPPLSVHSCLYPMTCVSSRGLPVFFNYSVVSRTHSLPSLMVVWLPPLLNLASGFSLLIPTWTCHGGTT